MAIRNTMAVSRTVTVILIIVILIIAAVAIRFSFFPPGTTTTTSVTSVPPTTLVMEDTSWPSLDMNIVSVPGTYPLWGEFTVYQPLIVINVTAEYQKNIIQYLPVLATNWTVSPDGGTYTFNLRHVAFSSGNPFNAYQEWVNIYARYYLSGNSTGWLDGYFLFDMSRVTFGPSTINLLNQSGLTNPSQTALSIMMNSSWPIYVTSPYSIVFHESSSGLSTAFLLPLLSYYSMTYDAQWVLEHGGFGTAASPNTYFNLNPAPGTGPYTTSSVSVNSNVIFTQSLNYWGANLNESEIAANPILDPGHVKTVIIVYKPDDVARYTDLSTGAAQIVGIKSANWNLVSNSDKYDYLKLPPWATLFSAISLNTKLYPTNVTAVRQAIVHSINYTDISEKAFFGQTSPMVGPEVPLLSDFYDLGNFSQYAYNLTLAEQYLAKANISNMPTLIFRTISGCTSCTIIAQIVQNDLAQIGITVNILVVSANDYYAPYGSYTTNVQNAGELGQISLLGGVNWAPMPTAADAWISFMSNSSSYGNWAQYYNPIVQNCVNSFFTTSSVTDIQSVCRQAQAQIYNDAPYAWLGINRLWYSSGSLVWQKAVIKNFYVDTIFTGGDTMPYFNTVTFG